MIHYQIADPNITAFFKLYVASDVAYISTAFDRVEVEQTLKISFKYNTIHIFTVYLTMTT